MKRSQRVCGRRTQPAEISMRWIFAGERKMAMDNIYLTGFMGTGKSTIAGLLAKELGILCMDLDAQLEREQKKKISELFDAYGEAYFRELETALLKRLELRERLVVSCGGGVVLREENIASMRRGGKIVLLTAEPETVWARVRGRQSRPLLRGCQGAFDIEKLMEQRRARYEAAADVSIKTDGKTPRELCGEILAWACGGEQM